MGQSLSGQFNSILRILTFGLGVLWFASSAAFGDTLSVGYVHYGQSFSVVNHGSGEGGGAGLFALSYVEPNGADFVQAAPGTIASYCIDLQEYIWPSTPSGPNTYDIIPLADAPNYASGPAAMGPAKAKAISQLWKEFVNNDGNNVVDDLNYGSDNNAAIQLAIWEIELEDWNGSYGGPDPWSVDPSSISAGQFYSTSLPAAITLADQYLSWVWNNPNARGADLVALSAPTLNAPGV